MTANEVYPLSIGPISAHCFNSKRDQIAICPNTNEVHIYDKQGSDWRLVQTLKGHDKLVTSIDWAPNTNRIVTASQDRNAYVWNFEQGQWKPTLVVVRINRAATFVRWSPLENKFAVASGARCVSICHFEEENNWWVSKHLRRPIRSTVLSIDWHPNNVLIAVGAADMKTRVFSAYIKKLDEKPSPTPWGERIPWNTLCAEYKNGNGGWVHSVAFSPDGNCLAWVGHDSSLTVANPAKQAVSVVLNSGLPLLSLLWVTPKSIIAVGHETTPLLFSSNDKGEWQFIERLDQGGVKKAAGVSGSAFNKFKQLDSKATEQNVTQLETTHQNTISSIRTYDGAKTSVTKFSTSGLDGKIVIWSIQEFEKLISGLKIQ
jgi:actin related protein 2/3 complex subunit 1A/1B